MLWCWHCDSVTSRSHDDIKHSKYNVLSCYDVDTVTLLHHDLMMTSNTVSTMFCLVMMWWSVLPCCDVMVCIHDFVMAFNTICTCSMLLWCDGVYTWFHDGIQHSMYLFYVTVMWCCWHTISWWHPTYILSYCDVMDTVTLWNQDKYVCVCVCVCMHVCVYVPIDYIDHGVDETELYSEFNVNEGRKEIFYLTM